MESLGGYRRRLAVNIAAHGSSVVWLMALTLACIPALLHGLGAKAFGLWVLIQTFSANDGWLSLADLGVAAAMARSVASHSSVGRQQEHRVTLASGMALLALIGVAGSLSLGLIGPHVLPALFRAPAGLRSAVRAAVVLFSVQVLLEFLQSGVLAGLEGAQRVDLSRVATVLTRTGQLGSTAFIALSTHSLVQVAAGSTIATGVGLAVSVAILRRGLPAGHGRPTAGEVRELVSYGIRIAGVQASSVLHRTMDRLVVGAVIGPSGVAVVEIATQVQGGASAILSSTTYVTFSASPWVLARGGKDKLRELLLRGTKYSVLATTPFVLAAMLFAHPLVEVWIGRSYGRAAVPVALAVTYIALASLITVGELMLEGTGRAGLVIGPSLVTTIVNLTLTIVLVHLLGVPGAFLATILAMLLFVPAVLRLVLHTYGVDLQTFLRDACLPLLLPSVAQVAVAAGVLALPLRSLLTLAVGGLLSTAAYAAVAWRWSLRAGEKRELSTLLRSHTSDLAATKAIEPRQAGKQRTEGPSGDAASSPPAGT